MLHSKSIFTALSIVILSLSIFISTSCNNDNPLIPTVQTNLPMWPQHGFNGRHTGNRYAPNPNIPPVFGISYNWIDTLKADTLGQGYMVTYPAIDSKGNIYYLHVLNDMQSGILYKVNPEGKILWTFQDSTLIVSWNCGLALSSDEKSIYIPGFTGLYCINSSGFLKWKIQTPSFSSNMTMPAIGKDGTIYSVIGPRSLCAINPDGGLIWLAPNASGAPSLDKDENIYVGWDDGDPPPNGKGIAKYDKNGNFKWKYESVRSPIGISIDANNNIYSEYGLGSLRDGLVSLTKDGALRWQKLRNLGDSSGLAYWCTPAIDRENNIYAVGWWFEFNNPFSGIIKLDTSGNILKKFPLTGNDTYYIPDFLLLDSDDNIYYQSSMEFGSFSKNGILRFNSVKTISLLTLSINSQLFGGICNDKCFVFTLK